MKSNQQAAARITILNKKRLESEAGIFLVDTNGVWDLLGAGKKTPCFYTPICFDMS